MVLQETFTKKITAVYSSCHWRILILYVKGSGKIMFFIFLVYWAIRFCLLSFFYSKIKKETFFLLEIQSVPRFWFNEIKSIDITFIIPVLRFYMIMQQEHSGFYLEYNFYLLWVLPLSFYCNQANGVFWAKEANIEVIMQFRVLLVIK